MSRAPRPPTRPPAFFLTESSTPGPSLASADARHALRVLRLGVGDLLVGLDGRGRRFPLRVQRLGKDTLELESAGPPVRDPAPGQEGSAIPWIEVAVSWPRRNRVEDMLGRLVQLGAAAIRPLMTQQRGPEEPPEHAPERWLRIAREACKQSGRTWLPVFEPRLSPAELASHHSKAAVAVLEPEAGFALDSWLRSLTPSPAGIGTQARPIVLVIGPEGGLTEEERSALLETGASPVWAAPHILRVETAAEAAAAIAAVVHGRTVGPRVHECSLQGSLILDRSDTKPSSPTIT